MDYGEVLQRLVFLLEGIGLLFVAKFVRHLFYLARSYKVSELIAEKNNVAAAIDLCGFLISMMLATTNSLIMTADSWAVQLAEVAVLGVLIASLLLVADWICDKGIFLGLDDHVEIYVKQNQALALCRFGVAIATGLILSGSLGDGTTRSSLFAQIPYCLLWFSFGQLVLVAVAYIYQRLLPYSLIAELKAQNFAVAWAFSGLLIASGLVLSSGVHGVHGDIVGDIRAAFIYVLVGVVLLSFLRRLADFVLLPGTKLNVEIRSANVGAGLVEGTSFILGGLLITYFLG